MSILVIDGFQASFMHDPGLAYRTPRWVKTAGAIAVTFLLLFGALHLVGSSLLGDVLGGHGNQAPTSSGTEHERHRP